jgi:aspartyl/glutamyl-tRNA(Asn/Gln) amidotransferase C subunit
MKFTSDFLDQIAAMAKLPITKQQSIQLAREFQESMAVVKTITAIDTNRITPTYQVNHLNNVLRKDEAKPHTCFTQAQALANAPKTYNGYFLVERVIDHES